MPKFKQKDLTICIRMNSKDFRLFYSACKRIKIPYSRMIRLLIDKWTYQQQTSDDVIDTVDLRGNAYEDN